MSSYKKWVDHVTHDGRKIDVRWDDEAEVFIASSNDIPGLNLEVESMDELFRELDENVPVLLEMNGTPSL